MKNLLLTAIGTLILCQSALSKIDTTIFSNDYERKVFESILDSAEVEPLHLFLALDYDQKRSENVETQIAEMIRTLDEKGISKKNTKAQVKEIYKSVHANNLKKYDEKIGFCALFESGEYNCVSGTAVYSMLLEHYNIPYTIKELPTHVYLIADPGVLDIKVESTMPNQGVIVYDRKSKEEYVTFLKENKLISKEEYDSKSVEELFQENFGDEVDISLLQLAALEYFNAGAFAYNDKKFQAAANNYEKAYIVYPSTTNNYMLFSAYANLLNEESIQGNFNGRHLASFVNYFSNDPTNANNGVAYYEMAVNQLVIKSANIEAFQQFHSEFMAIVNDSVDQDPFLQLYYGNMGYYEYTEREYSSSLNNLSMAYMLNEKDLQLKDLIKGVASEYIYSHKEDEGIIDTMDYYFTVFPFLLDDFRVLNLYAYTYSSTIYNLVNKKEITAAIACLDRMEASISPKELRSLDVNIVELSYTSLVGYYAEAGNYKKASVYIERGLTSVPRSAMLNQAKSVVEYTPVTTSSAPVVHRASLDEFNTEFPSCWKASYLIGGGESEDIPADDTMEISASKYSKVTVTMDGETFTGRWAFRSKSKLLYLIPDNDKENYLMFKVSRCDELLVMRLYEGKTLAEPSIYFERCD